MPTTDKKIILTGSPFAWVHLISYNSATSSWVITEKWKFDNLQSSTYKILKPGTTTTGGENIDITRADGAIWRFPKTTLILSGINEEDITPPDASSDATNKGEITLVTNEAPINVNSWTDFIINLQTHLNSKFMVTIGTGYSHIGRTSGSRYPDGFVHMIGKINNDIEQQLSNNPVSLSITFISCTNSGLAASALTGTGLFTDISLKIGKGENDPKVKPDAITSNDESDLLSGDIVVVVKTT